MSKIAHAFEEALEDGRSSCWWARWQRQWWFLLAVQQAQSSRAFLRFLLLLDPTLCVAIADAREQRHGIRDFHGRIRRIQRSRVNVQVPCARLENGVPHLVVRVAVETRERLCLVEEPERVLRPVA